MTNLRSLRVEVEKPGLKPGLSDPKSMFFTTVSHIWTQHKVLFNVPSF